VGAAPFDREAALRRQRASTAAMLSDSAIEAEAYGVGLDEELDDGFQ
jgi:hypothetical protein